jgi:hypothetical protein
LTDVSDVVTAPVALMMMGAVSTSETSVNFYQNTRRDIPEDIFILYGIYKIRMVRS